MKKLFFCISISLSHLTAQLHQKIAVPEVKESKIIDSVLNINLPKPIPSNSCVVLEVHRIGYMYDLYVDFIKTNLSIINLYKHDLKNNLRYFRYKGYLIFVTGPNDPYNFFVDKLKTTDFYFENSFNDGRRNDTDAKNENYLEMYDYQNGRFETILHPLH
jgi:hypothetical protein